jgi:hypothetical protein
MSNFYEQVEQDFNFEDVHNNQTNLVPMQSVSGKQITGPFVGYEAKYGQEVFFMAEKKLADRTDLTQQQRNSMLASYSHNIIELVEPKGTKGHLNEIMTIYGAMVKYHEPYLDKSKSELQPGYFRIVVKTDIMREVDMVIAKRVVTFQKNLLLSISANECVKYFLTIIESDRWYDFSNPIVGYFSGSQSAGYVFNVLTEDEAATIAEILAEVE